MFWSKKKTYHKATALFMAFLLCFSANVYPVKAAPEASPESVRDDTYEENAGQKPQDGSGEITEEENEPGFPDTDEKETGADETAADTGEPSGGGAEENAGEASGSGAGSQPVASGEDTGRTELPAETVSDPNPTPETESLLQQAEFTEEEGESLSVDELLELELTEDFADSQTDEEEADMLEALASMSFDAAEKARYTVLVLDCSGSMAGKPLTNLKKAAVRFSTQFFEADGTNYLAVVSYNSSSRIRCGFTTSLEEAVKVINGLSSGGGTNMCSGLQTAENLLSLVPQSGAAIKNIVLLSDGLPESGNTSKDGPYTSDDYSRYTYANAVYHKARSLWDGCFIYTLGFFHAISPSQIEFPRRFMKDLQNAGYYEVTDPEQLEFVFGEIAGDVTKDNLEFHYASGEERDYKAVCHYTDEYFYKPSCGKEALDGYNNSLSTASLCLALSAFGSNDVGSSNYSQKYKNVKELLEKLEFHDFDKNDWFEKKPQSDSIGVAAANKELTVDGHPYTLIAVAVRGGGYESEWAGNFTLGRSGQHYGFAQAKNQVLSFLKSYIREQNITGDIKIWLTGYSRAAATANMTAGALVDGENRNLGNVNLTKENLYAYCFETPMGVQKSEIKDPLKYNNIYNIINKNDPVTKVAMSALDFTRFGSDYFLPDKISDGQNYPVKKNAMLDFYNKMDSFSETGAYAIDHFKMKKLELKYILPGGESPIQDDVNNKSIQGDYLDTTINKLTKERIKSRDNYVNEFQNGIRTIFCAVYGTLFPDEPMTRIRKCLDLFLDKLCRMDTLGEIANAAFNPFSGKSVSDVLEGIMEEAMNEAGINNYNPAALAGFVGSVADLAVKFVVTHPNLTITGICNLETLGAAHYPELCLAWLMSQDPNYTDTPLTFDGNGNYRVIHINCPIDVNVYDSSGRLQASIQNNIPQDLGDTSAVASLNEDGEKLIFLPANASYSVQLTATADGELNYSVNEYSSSGDDITRIINYQELPVQDEEIMTASVPEYAETELNNTVRGSTTEYTLSMPDGSEAAPDQELTGEAAQEAYYMVTILSDSEEQGLVSGQGVRQAGHFAQIEAVPAEGYYFNGWYEGETLVAREIRYRFCVDKDITLTAHFTDDDSAEGVLPEDIPDGGVPQGLWAAGLEDGYAYTGRAVKPEIRVYDCYRRLREGRDYTLRYKNNIRVNDAAEPETAPSIIITGSANYSDAEILNFQITPPDIGGDAFAADDMALAYQAGKKQKPVPVLLWNGRALRYKTDYTVTYVNRSKPGNLQSIDAMGTYEIRLTGTGNFTGERTVKLTVSNLRMISKVTVAKIAAQSYTGSALAPALTVKDGKKKLTENTHYTVRYEHNTEVGTAYAVLTGIGGYCGTKRVAFPITGIPIKNAKVEGLDSQVYGGMNLAPKLSLSMKGKNFLTTLTENADYTVKWKNNRDAGTATVTLTGINGYTGTLKKTFRIRPFDISANTDSRFRAVVEQTSVPYLKGGAKPSLKVTFLRENGKIQTLKEGTDYTVVCKNNKSAAGSGKKLPTVIIRGKGNFKGMFQPLTYRIAVQNIGNLTLTAPDRVYQGRPKGYLTKVTVTDTDGKALTPGKDYEKELEYTYRDNTVLDDGSLRKAGTAIGKEDVIPAGTIIAVSVSGKGNYTGSLRGEYRITQADISKARVSIPSQIYTGEAITPDKSQITVRTGQIRLALNQYEIVGYRNNVKKGTASVTIRGIDNYGGTRDVNFRIRSKGFFWWWKAR